MAQRTVNSNREVLLEQWGAGGFWPWFLQRATGLALFLLLAVHIWVSHFAGLEEVTSGRQEELVLFGLVRERLRAALFILVDFGLLALALYHGLNGVRSILVDFGLHGRAEHAASLALAVVGIGAFLYGGNALLLFILG